jgi:hypothetical protein
MPQERPLAGRWTSGTLLWPLGWAILDSRHRPLGGQEYGTRLDMDG